MPNIPYLRDLLEDARGELSFADAAIVEGWINALANLPHGSGQKSSDLWLAAQAICAVCTFGTTVDAVAGTFQI